MPTSEHHSTIIIGAGLSGLYTAWKLQRRKTDTIVLEARNRVGGRIYSPQVTGKNTHCIDIGPAWIWPEFQPRMQQLLSSLNIRLFRQNTNGEILYEVDAKTIERHNDPSSHEMSYRVSGGAGEITRKLHAELASNTVRLNTPVSSIEKSNTDSRLCIQTSHKNKTLRYSADKVILALPPRLCQSNIAFTPALAKNVLTLWEETPTWMAGHCKIVFIYKQAFWRAQKLSGEVFSRHGPLSEIYDGSPLDETVFALTAFVGLNAHQRKSINTEQLIEMCLAQLQRLFGDASRNVIDIQIKDWAEDKFTTTFADINTPAHHPQYPANMPRTLWNNQLILASTEVAREHGGYLEGALESAEAALSLI